MTGSHDLIVTQHTRPGSVRLALTGELDYGTAPRLRAAVEQTALAAGDRLVIEMSGLAFCDSSGISALLAASTFTRTAGAALVLAAVPARVLNVFELTGLTEIFTVLADDLDASRRRPLTAR